MWLHAIYYKCTEEISFLLRKFKKWTWDDIDFYFSLLKYIADFDIK